MSRYSLLAFWLMASVLLVGCNSSSDTGTDTGDKDGSDSLKETSVSVAGDSDETGIPVPDGTPAELLTFIENVSRRAAPPDGSGHGWSGDRL